MVRYIATAAAGWIGVIGVGIGELLPFLLRRSALSRATGLGPLSNGPYLVRMCPHYWCGYLVAGVSTLHACLPMAMGRALVRPAGLWVATVALGILWVQVLTGLLLRDRLVAAMRVRLRSFHFWSMLACLTLIALHIRINA